MKANENWAEIVDTLHPYLDGSREKERYLKDIGNCLRFLGWRKTNGVMPAGRQEFRKTEHRAFEAGGGCRITGISRHDGIPWRDGVCHGAVYREQHPALL